MTDARKCPDSVLARFFMDHGMIHDRSTGQHVHTADDVEAGATERLFALLQNLDGTREALLALVELKAIKRRIEASAANDSEKAYYEASKEEAWIFAEAALRGPS